jgi:hypothetical protein
MWVFSGLSAALCEAALGVFMLYGLP